MFLLFCTGKITPYSDHSNKPIIEDGKIDIDRNGIFDVLIGKQFTAYPATVNEAFFVEPLNDTRILYNAILGKAEMFQTGDTISLEVNYPQIWGSFFTYLTWRGYPDTTHWAGSWASKRGYLPLKIKIEEEYHCAWINMKIDTLRDNYEVYAASYNEDSNQDFIIINNKMPN